MTAAAEDASDGGRPALVVCDLMGTTLLDGGEVAQAFRSALAACGRTVSDGEIAAIRGRHKLESMARLLGVAPDDPAARRAHALLREHLAAAYRRDGLRVVPGAPEALAWLRARGVKVALTTGFERALTEVALAAARWERGAVDALVTGDEVAAGRPAPYLIFHAMEATGTRDVRRVAVVGDTDVDLEAGANAGARWVIGVRTGPGDRRRLEAGPHTHLLDSVAGLPALWPDQEAARAPLRAARMPPS